MASQEKVSPPPPYETPFGGDETARIARQSIDREMDTVHFEINERQKRMFVLKKKRNELSITYGIPTELLARIFIFLRDLYNEGVDVSPRTQAKWMRVGRVCHYWREVAFDCPTLWATPIFSNRKTVREMLKYSKNAALTVQVHVQANFAILRMMPLLGRVLKNHFFRIKTLIIKKQSIPHDDFQKVLESFLNPAPLLQTVSLTNCYGIFGPNYMIHIAARPMIAIPNEAFKEAHSLRRIELEGFGFSWRAALFKHSGLIELHLENQRNVYAVGSSEFKEMIGALNKLPGLRILKLIYSLPSPPVSHCQPLTFLKLEKLVIHSRTPECAAFLRHTRFPARTEIKLLISLDHNEENLEDCNSILSSVGGMIYRAASGDTRQPSEFRTFQFAYVFCESTQESNTMALEMNDKELEKASDIPVVRIDFLELPDPSFFERMWKEIVTRINNSDILYFRATGCPVEWQIFRETIGKFPKLIHLYLDEVWMPDFKKMCRAIREEKDRKTVEDQNSSYVVAKKESTFVFPPATVFTQLKRIIIHEAIFEGKNYLLTLKFFLRICMQRSLPIKSIDVSADYDDVGDQVLTDGRLRYIRKRIKEVLSGDLESPGAEDSNEELEEWLNNDAEEEE